MTEVVAQRAHCGTLHRAGCGWLAACWERWPALSGSAAMGGNMLVAGLVMWLAVVLLAGRVRGILAGRGA